MKNSRRVHVVVPYLEDQAYEKYQKFYKTFNPGQKFYSMFCRGLLQSYENVKIYSYISNDKKQFIGTDPSITYVDLGSISQRKQAVLEMKNKICENMESEYDIIIADFEMYLCLAAALKCGKSKKCKVVASITDFPHHVYSYSQERSVDKFYMKFLKYINAYRKLFYAWRADAYILLTEYMTHYVGCKKPYMVIEGFCNKGIQKVTNKDFNKKQIVYLGSLNDQSGILNLVQAFLQIKRTDVVLNIYGQGMYVDKIKEYSLEDNRIRYKGVVSFKEAVEVEKNAFLLINPRPSKEKFNRYSFPSKTLEYMSSGTALISTRLSGIPEEYEKYIFWLDDSDNMSLTKTLNDILDRPEKEILQMGEKAYKFVNEEKNNKVQAEKVLKFISTNL